MANEVNVKQGTAKVWAASGGDYTMTFTSLADGDGRAGAEHDMGATFAARMRIELEVVFGTAPTAGNRVDVYWASSDDGTDYDGEVTGSDAAYNSEDDARRLWFVGSLSASNDTSAQRASWVLFTPARYGVPVVLNQSGQALSATAADHKLTMTPLIDEVQ